MVIVKEVEKGPNESFLVQFWVEKETQIDFKVAFGANSRARTLEKSVVTSFRKCLPESIGA